jgi:hypothetical protein
MRGNFKRWLVIMTDAFELVIEKAAFIPLCAGVSLTKIVQNNENF